MLVYFRCYLIVFVVVNDKVKNPPLTAVGQRRYMNAYGRGLHVRDIHHRGVLGLVALVQVLRIRCGQRLRASLVSPQVATYSLYSRKLSDTFALKTSSLRGISKIT
jgi:hypothetical protein